MTNKLLDSLVSDSNVMMIISIFTCVFGAYVLNRTIEKPFMRLRSKILERNKT